MATRNILTEIRKSRGEAAVIFIHGIFSDAQAAWTSQNGTFWPVLFANEKEVSRASVYTFEYPAAVFNRNFGAGHAAQLLFTELQQRGLLSKPVIVFVCHSLGGIIARQLVLSSQLKLKDTSVGFVLLASPSLGSNYANLARLLNWAIKNRQVQTLRFSDSNEFLNALDATFFNLAQGGLMKITGREILETEFLLPTNWRIRLLRLFFSRPIVRPFQGQRYFPNCILVPHADHFTISKPENREAIQHRALVSFVSDLLKQVSRPNSKRKKGVVPPETHATIRAIQDAKSELDNSAEEPYAEIIKELNRERDVRSKGQNFSSTWDGYDLRKLPAFLEGVWETLMEVTAGKIDTEAVFRSEIGGLVLLCDESIILWEDEPVPKSDEYWHDFNLFAGAMKKERNRNPRS